MSKLRIYQRFLVIAVVSSVYDNCCYVHTNSLLNSNLMLIMKKPICERVVNLPQNQYDPMWTVKDPKAEHGLTCRYPVHTPPGARFFQPNSLGNDSL
jgi:hypothetical protein